MTKTILLVEDDEKIALALSLRLKAMGYVVNAVENAGYAIKAAAHSLPKVVLLDINLPGRSGFIVADRLRSSSFLVKTPIVFITASKDPALRKRASQVSDSCFLEKPFRASELEEVIEGLSRSQH